MPVYNLSINGQMVSLEAEAEMPLLWALRDLLGLTGTKYSCGMGICGTCTVLIEGQAFILGLVPANRLAWQESLTLSLGMNLASFGIGWLLPV